METLLSHDKIKEYALGIGFQDCGIAIAEHLETEAGLFLEAIRLGKHAGMTFLERGIDDRFIPESLLPGCKTVVVVTYNYLTDSTQATDKYLIARYAHIIDYHIVVKEMLQTLALAISEQHPGLRAKATVDSSAISEKAWAVKSGVGCIGKNGIVHNSHGSFFVIGTLLLDRVCDKYDEPAPKSDCGDCDICVKSCPVNALETPYSVDARRCVSYLNTEDKNPIYSELAKQKYIFGCDICQEVCPKNKKKIANVLNETKTSLFLPLENSDYECLDSETFSRCFARTSILRRKFYRFRQMIDAKGRE